MSRDVLSLLVAIVIASAALAVLFLASYRRSGPLLAVLAGFSAGFVELKLGRIHLFTLAVILWLAFNGGRSMERLPRGVAVLLCALPLAATALTGDLVNSPTLALQLLALAGSAAILAVFATTDDARRVLLGLLAACTVGSAAGLLQVVGLLDTQVWHPEISRLGRPTGLQPEPDWLGLYA